MIWHLHRWTRYRSFMSVVRTKDAYDRVIQETYTPMQEKTCIKCGKIKQRKV